MPNMTPAQLTKLAIAALEDVKGSNIELIDVAPLTSIADHMVICTGTSNRHVKALADNVMEKAREAGVKGINSQGLEQGDWALVDLNGTLVHVMQASARLTYQLEKLWDLGQAKPRLDEPKPKSKPAPAGKAKKGAKPAAKAAVKAPAKRAAPPKAATKAAGASKARVKPKAKMGLKKAATTAPAKKLATQAAKPAARTAAARPAIKPQPKAASKQAPVRPQKPKSGSKSAAGKTNPGLKAKPKAKR